MTNHKKTELNRRLGSQGANAPKCALGDFGFFWLWFQLLFFRSDDFFCVEKSNERKKNFPLVTHQSIKNFTDVVIGVEK
jgi:hypothetical protein